MYKFFSTTVPEDMIHATPNPEVGGSEYADELRKISSKNNVRLDLHETKIALDDSTNVATDA